MEITTDKYNKDHSERVSEGLTDLQLHLLTCCLLTIISRHTHQLFDDTFGTAA